MSVAVCPSCKSPIERVRPVRLAAEPDSPRWVGQIPQAIGFVCPQCSVLLPLTAMSTPDLPDKV